MYTHDTVYTYIFITLLYLCSYIVIHNYLFKFFEQLKYDLRGFKNNYTSYK